MQGAGAFATLIAMRVLALSEFFLAFWTVMCVSELQCASADLCDAAHVRFNYDF